MKLAVNQWFEWYNVEHGKGLLQIKVEVFWTDNFTFRDPILYTFFTDFLAFLYQENIQLSPKKTLIFIIFILN